MRARDLRRALLRAAVVAPLALGALGALSAMAGRPPFATVVTVVALCLLLVPVALVEFDAARRVAAGRDVDVFLRTLALTVALLPLLALQHAYVDTLARTRAPGSGLVAALGAAGALLSDPISLLVGLPILATPIALAATLRVHRSFEVRGLATFILVMVGLPILCAAPLVLFGAMACAYALVGLYALADRLDRRWRWRLVSDEVAALARRQARGELTPLQVRLLAHVGNEAACSVLSQAEPDDGAPDSHVWTKGLLDGGPRAVARAAVAAARLANPGVAGRAADALAAAEACLAGPFVTHAGRARAAIADWTPAESAERAVVEAVHSVVERQPWCGIDAVRAAIAATGDADAVRAAIRVELERHLAEL